MQDPFMPAEESSCISSLSGVRGSSWRVWRSTSLVSQLSCRPESQKIKQISKEDGRRRGDPSRRGKGLPPTGSPSAELEAYSAEPPLPPLWLATLAARPTSRGSPAHFLSEKERARSRIDLIASLEPTRVRPEDASPCSDAGSGGGGRNFHLCERIRIHAHNKRHNGEDLHSPHSRE